MAHRIRNMYKGCKRICPQSSCICIIIKLKIKYTARLFEFLLVDKEFLDYNLLPVLILKKYKVKKS